MFRGALPFGSGALPPPTSLRSGYGGRQPCPLRPVARSGEVARDALQESLRHQRDLVDRALESLGVTGGRLAKPAHLAHELPRRGPDLVIGRDHVGVTQRLDASTHATTIEGAGTRRSSIRRRRRIGDRIEAGPAFEKKLDGV